MQNLAYQKHALEGAGLRLSGCYLVHVFVGYERGRELSLQDLFRIVPVEDELLRAEQLRSLTGLRLVQQNATLNLRFCARRHILSPLRKM